MSEPSVHNVECDCGAALEIECVDSINVERVPHLREAILERTFHTFRCGACGAGLLADRRVLYMDLTRQQFYAQYPESERAHERACAKELVAAWHVGLGDQAPLSVAAMFEADGFHVRLCFGLEELREKIVANDAELKDLSLEVLKAELMAENQEWSRAGVRTMRLDHVEPDGRLAFVLEQASDPPRPLEVGILVERSRYDAIAREPWRALLERCPWMASGPHVSLLRLHVPGVAEELARDGEGEV